MWAHDFEQTTPRPDLAERKSVQRPARRVIAVCGITCHTNLQSYWSPLRSVTLHDARFRYRLTVRSRALTPAKYSLREF